MIEALWLLQTCWSRNGFKYLVLCLPYHSPCITFWTNYNISYDFSFSFQTTKPCDYVFSLNLIQNMTTRYFLKLWFSSSHVQIWEFNHKEGWALRNWFFQTVVLEKTLEGLLDYKEIKPVNSKGKYLQIFIGSSDAEAGALILLATWCEELTHWKRLWCWEGLGAGGKGDDRG